MLICLFTNRNSEHFINKVVRWCVEWEKSVTSQNAHNFFYVIIPKMFPIWDLSSQFCVSFAKPFQFYSIHGNKNRFSWNSHCKQNNSIRLYWSFACSMSSFLFHWTILTTKSESNAIHWMKCDGSFVQHFCVHKFGIEFPLPAMAIE